MKDLEKAFVRAMNWVIGNKETFLEKRSQDMYQGLEPIEEEYTMEELYIQLEEMQQGEKAGNVSQIKSIQNRMGRLKEQQTEHAMREKRVKELKDYLMAQESGTAKFDEQLFRKFVEKVIIQSMAEVAFVLKVGLR